MNFLIINNMHFFYRKNIILNLFFAAIILLSLFSAHNAGAEKPNFQKAVDFLFDGDGASAARILDTLSAEGSPQAQALLGDLLADGIFVEQNLDRAWHLLNSSKSKQNPHALYKTAELCLTTFTNRDCDVGDLLEAALLGNPSAQYLLGQVLIRGKPSMESIEEAIPWFKLSAENGNHKAAELLVHTQFPKLVGVSSELDYSKLRSKLLPLANQGFHNSQFFLGLIFLYGHDVRVDIDRANMWLQLASYQGNESAKDYVKAFQKDKNLDNTLAIDWLNENAGDDTRYFGVASKWCLANPGPDLKCLAYAIRNHERCLPPNFGELFKGYVGSRGYHLCRWQEYQAIEN